MSETIVLTSKHMENQLLEQFGNSHLENALRIISTKIVTEEDDEMVHDAMCILVAMYTHKLRTGEITQGVTLH